MRNQIVGFTLLLVLFLSACSNPPSSPTTSNQDEINQNTNPPENINSQTQATIEPFQASFAIYTRGTFRIFTDPMYHNRSKKAYITLDAPNQLYVAQPPLTWQEFFDTLPFKLTTECLTTGTGQKFCTNQSETLHFYLNGQPDTQSLSMPISPDDKLLITYDTFQAPRIQDQLKQLQNI